MRPATDIAEVRASHARLLATVDALDDDTAARPSLLPAWNVAMVVTHLARHADSQRRGIEGALAGEVRARYPSMEDRDSGITAGRAASAGELQDDLRAAIERLEAAYDELDDDAWGTGAVDRLPGLDREAMTQLPFQRWREVEVHHADLGLGYAPADWPVALAERWLPELLATLMDRAELRALMAWTLGRGPAPELEAWR